MRSKENLAPDDITIQVNNGDYFDKIEYSDYKFKEPYLMYCGGKQTFGYDCLVKNPRGEAVAWVEAHYYDGWSEPFRVKIYGFKAKSFTFPVEFFYNGSLIKRCNITVDMTENNPNIARPIVE